MKPLKHALVMLLLCFASASYAQTGTKSSFFSNQPDRLTCNSLTLSNAFNKTEGQAVTINFSDRNFSGRVISNIVKYSNLQSMTIQLTGFRNAVLHLSKQTNADNTFSYVGRIMHNDANDGYMMETAGNDYAFKKINTQKILETCH